MRVNRQVRLRSRPTGIVRADHVEIARRRIDARRGGEIAARNRCLSVEPKWETTVGIWEIGK